VPRVRLRDMARVSVCGIADLPSTGALCRRLADGTQIAVARLDGAGGKVVAFENRCPHVNGPLGLGKIKGTTVTCPWHFFRFDIETGAAVGLDSVMRVRVFKTAVEDGQVFVES
jgi:nitrite reductase (NADH) small subunit